MSDKKLITAQNLAQALHLSVETIWKYTREKKIPYIELGNKQYRYQLDEVMNSLRNSKVQEKKAGYNPEPTTYQDYLELPEEPGYRFEVLEGQLIKEPSPNVIHQRVSRQLLLVLADYLGKADPQGEILYAPLDVTFQDTTVVQPDLFYVSGEQKDIVKENRIDGSPTLIVEILSPSGTRKDRLQKMGIYQTARVQHYWLVNPEEKTLECFSLQKNLYALVASGMDEDVVEHPDFPELSITLKNLWHQS